MVVTINEETKKNILSIDKFEEVKTNKSDSGSNSWSESSLDSKLKNSNLDTSNLEDAESSNLSLENIIGNNTHLDTTVIVDNESENEQINKEEIKNMQSESTNTTSKDGILAGGLAKGLNLEHIEHIDIIYNIDYILDDDEKLINPEKVFKQVDIYITNYNSSKMQKYKQSFKNLYQKYSNKNYTIMQEKHNTTTKIVVTRNDKTKKVIVELIKPSYLFYDNDDNLIILKRKISNARTELLYKYEVLIAKINITPEEKKEFEKERTKFIELLEDYYTYTLYHKKINNIITNNKSNIILQKEIVIYKENNDYESKILSSNIYSIDNSIIDIINKNNYNSLSQYNNIILSLSGKKEIEINKDKKIIDSIKTYIKNKIDIDLYSQSLFKKTDIQDEYINYIILDVY